MNQKTDLVDKLETLFNIEAEDTTRLGYLTPRELEVLASVALGYKNRTIAGDLNISPKTLDVHRGNIFRKLQTKSVVTAANMLIFRNAAATLGEVLPPLAKPQADG